MEKTKVSGVESAIKAQMAVLEEQIENIKLQRKALKKSLKMRKAVLLARAAELSKLKEGSSDLQCIAMILAEKDPRQIIQAILQKEKRNIHIRVEYTPQSFIAYVYAKEFYCVRAMNKREVIFYLDNLPIGTKNQVALTINGKPAYTFGVSSVAKEAILKL